MVGETAAGCVAVEAAEGVVLATPVAIDRTGSSQECLHPFGSDLAYLDVHSHVPAKRVEQALGAFKFLPHRLPECCVLGDQLL